MRWNQPTNDDDDTDYFPMHPADNKLRQYLKESRQHLYANVTWQGLREHSSSERGLMVNVAKRWYFERYDQVMNEWRGYQCCSCCYTNVSQWCYHVSDFNRCFFSLILFGLFHIFVPIYVISRLFNVCYLWICLFIMNDKLSNLQIIMASFAIAMQFTWLCSFYYSSDLLFMIYHVFYGHSHIFADAFSEPKEMEKGAKYIVALHNAYICEPVRRAIITDFFGPDVGSIVELYLPTLLTDL